LYFNVFYYLYFILISNFLIFPFILYFFIIFPFLLYYPFFFSYFLTAITYFIYTILVKINILEIDATLDEKLEKRQIKISGSKYIIKTYDTIKKKYS